MRSAAKAHARKHNSEKRAAPREQVEPIAIRGFTSIDHMTLLSRMGHIVQVSTTGFLLRVERKNLVPVEFREMLSLDALVGDRIILTIDPLNLELSGEVVRVHRVTKDIHEIAIDFSEDAPEYWRECLLEMLPRIADMD